MSFESVSCPLSSSRPCPKKSVGAGDSRSLTHLAEVRLGLEQLAKDLLFKVDKVGEALLEALQLVLLRGVGQEESEGGELVFDQDFELGVGLILLLLASQ
jgi:hypothetical protein